MQGSVYFCIVKKVQNKTNSKKNTIFAVVNKSHYNNKIKHKTMKKLILPMIAAFVLLTGCGEKARVITSYYTVKPNQWEYSITTYNDGTYTTNYAYSVWENIDIDAEVIMNGVVMAYYLDNDGRDNILPYTLYFTDDAGVPYQERFEYDIEPGKITFKIKDTDFNTQASMANIGTMKFKVSVIRNF